MGEDGKVDIALIMVGIIELVELLKKYSHFDLDGEFDELVSVCERIIIRLEECDEFKNSSNIEW